MRVPNKFIQIQANDRALNALDDQGNVWVFVGAKLGWKKMNMNVAEDDAQPPSKTKYRPGVPPGWNSGEENLF